MSIDTGNITENLLQNKCAGNGSGVDPFSVGVHDLQSQNVVLLPKDGEAFVARTAVSDSGDDRSNLLSVGPYPLYPLQWLRWLRGIMNQPHDRCRSSDLATTRRWEHYPRMAAYLVREEVFREVQCQSKQWK